MAWIILAVLTAIFNSLVDLVSKFSLKRTSPIILGWAMEVFALPFLLPLVFITEIPELDRTFFIALIVSGGLNAFIIIIYMRAIQVSDLSLTLPLLTFTPLFLLLTSPIMVHEVPNMKGFLGVLMIVSGAYFMNIKQYKQGFLAPIKTLLHQKGPRLMLLVAFLWSITGNVDKIGIQHSSVNFWILSMNWFILLSLTPFVIWKAKPAIKTIFTFKDKKLFRLLLLLGFFSAIMFIVHMTALDMNNVAYLIAIKRASVIMGVLYGFFIFKEKDVGSRLIGATVMVAGVMLIALA